MKGSSGGSAGHHRQEELPLPRELDRSHCMKKRSLTMLAVVLVGVVYLIAERWSGGGVDDRSAEASQNQRSTPRRVSSENGEAGTRNGKFDRRDMPRIRGQLPPRAELIASGVRMGLEKDYGDFIASLQLSEEESEYFMALLTVRKEVDRDLTLRWLNAPAAEKDLLFQQINDRQFENTEAISRFLNHPDDLAAFLEYEQQIPERQSLDGFDLEESARHRLIGILHGLRIESGEESSTRLASLDSIIRTGSTDAIEEQWKAADQKLPDLLSEIFTEAETQDFVKHWSLVRERQLREYAATLRNLDPDGHRSE